ncbi:zinc-binding dehydrogenase [Microvirga guangxiensis]|uniref:NADPH:quinone reductase n=1 Tax=Microvirga guangxiensis TaxID=549386 RepID=A0A1G5F0Z3_9HYPH|nr:zinc-binding dehydrogenase [Microvirga guangxiensis]SCY32929.1 NADPH:quinone reductase [Microvirga guangxiensis]
MRAAFITGHGGNEVVQIGQRPEPIRAPGEILVRVKAATLNRVDLYMRDSGAGITHTLPQIMGLDGAGVVEEVGADERRIKVGDRVVLHPGVVCGRCEFCQRGEQVLCVEIKYLGEHRDGTIAELVSVPADNVFPMPEAFSFAEAASLGVNYLTAWRMIFTKTQVKPWETVLIFGIGGGVSLAALQLVKAIGAKAIVTSRDDAKLQRARAMGADGTINGRTQDIARMALELTGGRGVDVVIENVGEAVWPAAMRSLVRGGRLATCGATTGDNPSADLRRLFIRQLQIFGSTAGNFSEFRDLIAFCKQGTVKPIIDSLYPLDQMHAALSRLEAGEQFGKVAIEIEQH